MYVYACRNILGFFLAGEGLDMNYDRKKAVKKKLKTYTEFNLQ